jgi:hypothetical protein
VDEEKRIELRDAQIYRANLKQFEVFLVMEKWSFRTNLSTKKRIKEVNDVEMSVLNLNEKKYKIKREKYN